jgi:hypothetical protein
MSKTRGSLSEPRHPEHEESVLRTIWSAWEQFWFRPSSPTTLAVMRIFAGLVMLYVFFGYGLALLKYVGPEAWENNRTIGRYLRDHAPQVAPKWDWRKPTDRLEDTVDVVAYGQPLWSVYFHIEDPFWIAVVHGAVMVVTFLFTIGFATRITSVLTWAAGVMYINRAASSLFGMDTMTNLGLLYLMIAPCGAVLSVDRWLEVRRFRKTYGPDVPVPPVRLVSATFATRLVQINFCFIYMMAGMSKLLGSSWWNATAPNLVLLNYSFAPFQVGLYNKIIGWLAGHRMLWEIVMTGGVLFTLWTELGLPFLIWVPKMRWFMICCSAVLHTQIGLFMGLVTFSLMMLVLLLAFIPPEVTEDVLDRLRESCRRLGRAGARPPAGKPAEPVALAR